MTIAERILKKKQQFSKLEKNLFELQGEKKGLLQKLDEMGIKPTKVKDTLSKMGAELSQAKSVLEKSLEKLEKNYDWSV